MKKTLITRDQFKIMPWKNGGGVTAEIAIEPAGSDFLENQFEWRLSSAHILDENKFSQFPGYNRILTVLSGQGLMLDSQELGPFEFFEFEGEENINCSLIENPVEDLNIIFKREQYECSMQILNVTAPMYLKLNSGINFFLSLASQVNVSGTNLMPPDFLRIEEANGIEINSKTFPAHLLRIEIKAKV